jgi:alpha-glucosidase
MAEYTQGGDKLHMGYSFELLTNDYSSEYIRTTVQTLEQRMLEGWPCWAFSNHDVERVASRWSENGEINPQQCKMLTALLASLRGSVCMYQGEELGLGEASVAFEDLQDPYGITFWPNFKGRDGCRTPMPWEHTGSHHAGFSEAKPWLPVDDAHKQQSVAIQINDSNSILNAYREFMTWRKSQAVLLEGDIEFIETPEPALAFYRTLGSQKMLCVFNLSSQQASINMPVSVVTQYTELSHHNAKLSNNLLTLEPYACYYAKC